MNAIQGYLEKLGGNFLVASFIPSLAFVIASIVTFGPIIPERVLLRAQHLLNPLGQFGLVVVLIAVIIGFTLTSLNTQVYKLFEGYVFIKKLSFFRKLELKRARELRNEKESIDRKIEQLEMQLEIWDAAELPPRTEKQKRKFQERIEALRSQRDDVSVIYDQRYPPIDSLILPTRLGNILRAAETYPRTRYNIDAVPMWPRIIYSVSTADKGESFLSKVDFSNDQCSFLLNFSLLSGIYALLAFIASSYQYFTLYLFHKGVDKVLYFIPIYKIPEVYTQRAVIYLVISGVGLGIAWYFYNASLWTVSAYGNLIRSTYDLFRFNLLEHLHLQLPVNSGDDDIEDDSTDIMLRERFLWRKVSEMFNIGRVNTPHHFDYKHSEKSSESKS